MLLLECRVPWEANPGCGSVNLDASSEPPVNSATAVLISGGIEIFFFELDFI
jgi:hypothetical protein